MTMATLARNGRAAVLRRPRNGRLLPKFNQWQPLQIHPGDTGRCAETADFAAAIWISAAGHFTLAAQQVFSFAERFPSLRSQRGEGRQHASMPCRAPRAVSFLKESRNGFSRLFCRASYRKTGSHFSAKHSRTPVWPSSWRAPLHANGIDPLHMAA